MKFIKINKFDLIIALYIFGLITVNLMGVKLMPLGHFLGLDFNISVVIFLMLLMFTTIDVVSEIYGRARARSIVFSGMIVLVLLVLFMALATWLPQTSHFALGSSYQEIFGISIRLAIASIVSFLCSELLDVLVYNRLREKMKGRKIWLRNGLANFAGTLVDTTLFMVISFYSVFVQGFGANVKFLLGMILPYWLAKCVMAIVGTPLVYAGIRYLRRPKTAKMIPVEEEVYEN